MTRSPHVWTITVDVVGRNVVLLDDVYTTGATACPSGARFKSAGAKTVKLLALEHRVPGGVLAELHLGARDAAVRRTSGGR
jgi:phosphoribosylpyrophosphate synthetase